MRAFPIRTVIRMIAAAIWISVRMVIMLYLIHWFIDLVVCFSERPLLFSGWRAAV